MHLPKLKSFLIRSLLTACAVGASTSVLADPPSHAQAHKHSHHQPSTQHPSAHKKNVKPYKQPRKHPHKNAEISQLNHAAILQLLLRQNIHTPQAALPPGIQTQLTRGKPLPPGQAKKLSPALYQQLPHYEGYEWLQIGTNVVLVAIASGLIYEVFQNVFN